MQGVINATQVNAQMYIQYNVSNPLSIIITSNKKHFVKNVKECRDVIVKKVLEQGRDAIVIHHTHFGPIPPYES